MKSKTTTDLVICSIKQETSQEICLTPELYMSSSSRHIKAISSKSSTQYLMRLSDAMTRDSTKLTVYSLEENFKWELEKKIAALNRYNSYKDDEEELEISDFNLDNSDSDSYDNNDDKSIFNKI